MAFSLIEVRMLKAVGENLDDKRMKCNSVCWIRRTRLLSVSAWSVPRQVGRGVSLPPYILITQKGCRRPWGALTVTSYQSISPKCFRIDVDEVFSGHK